MKTQSNIISLFKARSPKAPPDLPEVPKVEKEQSDVGQEARIKRLFTEVMSKNSASADKVAKARKANNQSVLRKYKIK